MNAFQRLRLPAKLTLSSEEVRDAFREATKTTHPDSNGESRDFAPLNLAFATLQSPARRLQLWLEIHDLPVETRGTVDNDLMEIFSNIGSLSQRATLAHQQRENSSSALARALLEPEIQLVREAVESGISSLENEISARTQCFEEIEIAPFSYINPSKLGQLVRELTFLEKWQSSLRALYGQLI